MSSIDVIIPSYQYGHFLRECVGSVLSQHGVGVRVLILDDASTDDTPQVCKELADSDKRVSYLRHQANKGHIATYNIGLDWAQSDYLLLLSADDVLTRGALFRATTLLDRNPEMSFACGESIVTEDPSRHPYNPPEQIRCEKMGSLKWLMRFCESGMNILGSNTSTVVVRTRSQKNCGHYTKELPHTADMEMWMRLSMHGNVGMIEAKQSFYRQHHGAMHHSYPGILDIKQRNAAFDSFFTEYYRSLPDAEKFIKTAKHSIAKEALKVAQALCFLKMDTRHLEWLKFAHETAPLLYSEISRNWKLLARDSELLYRNS